MVADVAPTKPASGDPITGFYNDLTAAWNKVVYHESSGKFAVIVLSLILTLWIWYTQGTTAATPVLASFFITLAFFV